MNTKKILPFATLSFLVGCTTSGQGESQQHAISQYNTKQKTISYDEAAAFERSLLAHELIPSEPVKLYTQPVNKKIPCKLPTSQDQLERPNFRAYWDGDCKNGFAFGLGRDIAISDTHHIEEITIHNENGDDWSQPRVTYDYVNSNMAYAVGGSRFPAETRHAETMVNSADGFNEYHTLSVIDESGNAFVAQTSEFHTPRIYLNTRADHSIAFRFSDYSSAPTINPNAVTFTAEILDPKTNTLGGVAIVRHANGSVRHLLVVNRKLEPTMLPSDYIDHLADKYQEVKNATDQANTVLQQAQQIEREYLFKACNGKSRITGLDKKIYTKICTWRDQFKEPYAAALSNYQRQQESMRQQATYAEQQRQIQQQQESMRQQAVYIEQQRQIQQQQQQQDQQLQQNLQQLQQSSQQLLQNSQQTLERVNNWQAPIIAPSKNRVTCNTIGSIVTCH